MSVPTSRFGVRLATIAALTLISCDQLRGIYSYRYRITVEVETPQGVRSGSSVWQIKQWKGNGIPDEGMRSRMKGEAVAVRLPSGTLFAPLESPQLYPDYPSGIAVGHFRVHPQPGLEMGPDWWSNVKKVIAAKPAFELDPDEYPLLVRFRDPADPTSVERVEPSDLEHAFGPGTHLRRITVALTEDQPKREIANFLPWLGSPGAALQRCPMFMPHTERPLACLLIYSDFRRY